MQITLAWLKSQTPCIPEHIELFRREWGESAEVTRETLLRAAELGFELTWLANRILSPDDLARFRSLLDDDAERGRVPSDGTGTEQGRQRLREALARAEMGRRAMVDPAIEKYRAATAGELRAYNAYLAAKAPAESHESGLARFRQATEAAEAELRGAEAAAYAAYHAAVHPIEREVAALMPPGKVGVQGPLLPLRREIATTAA